MMKLVAIVNRTRDSVLATAVSVADQWWQRARGFLGRPEPKSGEGLLLNPCRAVHMIGMHYVLDVVFLDRQGRVLAVYPRLAPGRRSSWHARARYAIELPGGTIHESGTQVGDLIAWLPADGVDFAGPGLNDKVDHVAASAASRNQHVRST
jgi:uncharacterized protein